MFSWFEKTAPIRVKFRALLAIHSAFALIALGATWFAVQGGGLAMVAIAAACAAGTAATVLISGKLICTPYVNTVLRMEALARGDVSTPINYTD